jgi:hypothetical protein
MQQDEERSQWDCEWSLGHNRFKEASMEDDETVPGETMINIKGLKKRIVPFEEEGPATEPLFINYAHGAFVGGSAYLDVGVIPLEEFDPSGKNPDGIVEFAVLTRLVMSKATLTAIRDQINALLTPREEAEREE